VAQLRAQLAEGGGGDLAARLAHEEAEATHLHSIIEMQKTIPVVRGGTSLIWLGPHRAYTAAAVRRKAIEDALAFG